MPTVRSLPIDGTESVEPYDEEVFVSLEDTPIVLADIRVALPQLQKELAARWPITRVEIENKKPILRRNPHDPTHTTGGGAIGILIDNSHAFAIIGLHVGWQAGKFLVAAAKE